ncbi:ABC transporter substrate-binding protein [Dongia deserti]|uniref:ABC transporter substrate-binding protein n=1 Tax=Dongia deserti TaxID=2268030 RepID=UPI000E65C3BF|nr:ABC transporter substrate-binding protein [Dongia deserti]
MKRLLASVSIAAMVIAAAPVSTPAFAEAKQGGEMIVTFKDDLATLDPAIGYDWTNWSIIKSIFDGLMDYKPGTTELVPDLAESYDVSPDGLTYTFKLRQGVKFHNGREMTAADVKYSLERTCNPATQSPGAGYYAALKGFDEFQGGSAKELSGVQVVDDHTVKIELSRPDSTLLHLMALNFAFIVPKEAIEESGADFGRSPVGTGAFKLTNWTVGQSITLERNADYFKAGIPKLDKITFQIGQDPVVNLLRLQKGEIDIPGNGIPPAKFTEVMNDPTWKEQVIVADQLHTGYVTMNVNIPPFDKVAVRQAVNMAINKDRIVQVINNRAVPANQPLPPAMPGYDKSFKGYAYDVAGAKAKLKEAGLEGGFETDLYVSNTDPQPRIAQAIQQDLAAIGIKANIKSLDQTNVIAAGGRKDGTPMLWSGGMAWIADFPDPSNFYTAILGCGGAVDGGWNWAWYCNEELDKRAEEANAMTDPAKEEERAVAWGKIFTDLMEDAPWVPIFNEKHYLIHSKRIDGPAGVFADPIHIPVNYDEVYATDAQ